MKLPKCISKKTISFFNNFKPEILFIFSIFSLAIFLFINNTALLWIIAGVFFILALLRRGSVRILPSILITLCVTFFALLSPYGKILITFGSFRITEDALLNGLHRSAILTGMVFISQFAVSPKLKLPGKAGIFLSQTFCWLDKLTSKKISFKPGTIIKSIDDRLYEIWNDTSFSDSNISSNSSNNNTSSNVETSYSTSTTEIKNV